MTERIFATFTEREEAHVQRIISRAVQIFNEAGFPVVPLDLRMDLSAAHHSCPLDLTVLAYFPDYDLIHDVGGIRQHLNRITGELMDRFLPRCAVKS